MNKEQHRKALATMPKTAAEVASLKPCAEPKGCPQPEVCGKRGSCAQRARGVDLPDGEKR